MKRKLRSSAQYQQDARFCQRCKIVWNLVKGNSLTSVKGHLQCSFTTINRVARRFVEEGMTGLVDRREDNGVLKMNEDHEEFLLEAAAKSPRNYGYDRPTWTLELFVRVLRKEMGVQVSTTTMSRTLARLKVRCKQPKPIVLCPWKKAARTRKLKAIRRLLSTVPEDEVILYVDEVDIHLNPKIGPDWMPNGMQKSVTTPGKNEKRYLAGALNARTGRLTFVEGNRKTSDLFIDQLWTLVLDDYPNAKRIHLILDNYRIHKSQRTQIALDALEDKLVLHFLPPYCPDHNKIERVWKDLHANVTRNHQCRTMKELMREVRKYLRKRDKELQRYYAEKNNKIAA
jgi:transposase